MCKLIQFPIKTPEETDWSKVDIDELYEQYYSSNDNIEKELWRENCQREEEHKESWFDKLINKLLG
ncbi:hypothetical protein [Desulfitobacterium metallireducens]|uniref:Uncharacterized protein n=1 Tax=Desulfitobacterium metallireducens DSM 15288 TaxID=871968 RepID=W0EH96_9FIRM|nr:hypothetical protein [Desulfitobacterium metallireducens]AHF08584.1 hypothetical protein DESME_09020 [Desulfitobacterium metallireducens DSM 15288]